MTAARRSGILVVLAGLLALVLSACAGLPVSGPVKLGRSAAEAGEDPPVFYVPAGPSIGMTPQQVVEGFIAAGSGPRDDWGTAQLFLTEDFRQEWEPTAGVTVYSPGQRTVTEPAPGEITVEIAPEASVDATGAYAVTGGPPVSLNYRLEQVDGEWRISEAPGGIVLDRNRFASVFRSYPLMFFDPSWTYLVPDQRWFAVENAATRIAEALIGGGPSPWLARSVVTSFTQSAGLASASVPVRSQVAEVPLRAAARDLDRLTLDRMQAQLEASLEAAGVARVQMLVDGQPLPASAVPVRSTRVDARTLVLAGGVFGFVSGAEIEQMPGLGPAVQDVALDVGVDAVEVDADRRTAAVRTADGEVRRVLDDRRWQTLDGRDGLIAPTMDDLGHIYTVPADAPSAVVAYAADGTSREITGAWPTATRVSAMRVSRDGTRIAALVRDGTQTAVWIAGIVRDDDAPRQLSDPQTLGVLSGEGIDLTWLDGSTLALLVESEGQRYVVEQPIGGPSSPTRAPEAVDAIAGGNASGEVRVLDVDGRLYGQRGVTWSPMVADVTVLAVQRGIPR